MVDIHAGPGHLPEERGRRAGCAPAYTVCDMSVPVRRLASPVLGEPSEAVRSGRSMLPQPPNMEVAAYAAVHTGGRKRADPGRGTHALGSRDLLTEKSNLKSKSARKE